MPQLRLLAMTASTSLRPDVMRARGSASRPHRRQLVSSIEPKTHCGQDQERKTGHGHQQPLRQLASPESVGKRWPASAHLSYQNIHLANGGLPRGRCPRHRIRGQRRDTQRYSRVMVTRSSSSSKRKPSSVSILFTDWRTASAPWLRPEEPGTKPGHCHSRNSCRQ